MALPVISLGPGDGTLVAVAVGAVLATAGGFVANQIEHSVRRRERERAAALLFGEILAAMKLIIGFAGEARGRGDPYGPITIRMVKAAHREALTYDRNRESLFDLRDGLLRISIHTLMVRLTLSLDGVLEASARITAMDPAANRDAYIQDRQGSFDFLLELCDEISPILSRLGRLARHSFDAHEDAIKLELNAQLTRRPS